MGAMKNTKAGKAASEIYLAAARRSWLDAFRATLRGEM